MKYAGIFSIALAIVLASVTLAGCVPLPQRVQEEFSAPDGKRPNNFELSSGSERKRQAGGEQGE